MSIKDYVLSWDFMAALILAIAAFLFEKDIDLNVLESFASFSVTNIIVLMGIIVACFAIISSMSADSFSRYIEGRGSVFSGMIERFVSHAFLCTVSIGFSAIVIFVLSVDLYIYALGWEGVLLSVIVFLFTYPVFYVLDVVREIALFSKKRLEYVGVERPEKPEGSEEPY